MRRSSAGFTLTEIVIVLAILSAMAVVTLPYVNSRGQSDDAQNVALQVANLLRLARAEAGRNSRPTRVRILLTHQRQIGVEPAGDVVLLPDNLAIRANTARFDTNPGETIFAFLPNGESTGGNITVGTGNTMTTVSVDWLTGRVSMSSTGSANK